MQSGKAERDVYVFPTRELPDRGRCVWILITAAYGLIRSNSKLQVLKDTLLTDIGFRQTRFLPQLLVLIRNKRLVSIVDKIVDDLLLSATTLFGDPIISTIQSHL